MLNAFPTKMMTVKFAELLQRTPFHPQWLVLKEDHFRFALELQPTDGEKLLDIGCGRGQLKQCLSDGVSYIGFDYPATGMERYHAKPDILGSAEALPLADSSMDIIICLEVMEHLPDPVGATKEMARILCPGGRAAISVPFAYPVHDAPFDFQRFTSFQLTRMFEGSGLHIESIQETGHALESAALLANLALAKTVLDGVRKRKPAALLLPLLIIQTPVINLLGWIAARLAGNCGVNFLPLGYQLRLRKPTV